MASNYIIRLDNGSVFCGWNQLGQMVIKSFDFDYLAYRMSRPIAERNLQKVEDFTHRTCFISSVK